MVIANGEASTAIADRQPNVLVDRYVRSERASESLATSDCPCRHQSTVGEELNAGRRRSAMGQTR